MKLSIIIPAYNAEPYIHELLNVLEPQITDEVEVLVIDDGSTKPLKLKQRWLEVIRQTNKGAAAARNTGLDNATGDYIAFIDADDLVSDNYIQTILNKAKKDKFDYCYLSWKAIGGWKMDVKLQSVNDVFPPFNLCVWNRIYKRSMIGKGRFNTSKVVAEDAQFIRDVKEKGKKKAYIGEYMYYYRSNTPDSLTKRVQEGTLKHNRIVYNLPTVPDDPKLLQEIIEADKTAEVIVLTNDCRLKGLEEYAMIIPPTRKIVGSELRGEPTPMFEKQPEVLNYQVVLYVDNIYRIGGLETFAYNFCYYMSKYYDICVVYCKDVDPEQLKRLLPYADVVLLKGPIYCDVAINCRLNMHLPDLIKAKKKINIVHSCKMADAYNIVDNMNDTYFVSKICAESFGYSPDNIIYNLTIKPEIKKRPIRLVSACRLTWEKGRSRILNLARMMNEEGINFTWEVFTGEVPTIPVNQLPSGLVFRESTLDVLEWVKAADFYVSVSQYESFGYSMVEALEMGVPVISTDIPVLPEIGLINGVNGWIIPLNVLETKNLKQIMYSNLKFKYDRTKDNEKIVGQWCEILGEPKEKTKQPLKVVKVLKDHTDGELNRLVKAGEYLKIRPKRAAAGVAAGFYEMI